MPPPAAIVSIPVISVRMSNPCSSTGGKVSLDPIIFAAATIRADGADRVTPRPVIRRFPGNRRRPGHLRFWVDGRLSPGPGGGRGEDPKRQRRAGEGAGGGGRKGGGGGEGAR